MSRAETTVRIEREGIVAVIRLEQAAVLSRVVEALVAGGVHAIEVTMTVPGAIESIRQLAASASDDVLLGAGTVLDPETARRAIDAGARFVVAPVFRPTLIEACHARRRARPARLLHAHRNPECLGRGRGHREGVSGRRARAGVLQGRARAAAAA